MKEYLTKNSSGNYQLVNHRFSEDDIEIPCGMNFAWKDGDSIWFTALVMGYRDAETIWERSGKESLNDKIATAEVARQKSTSQWDLQVGGNHYKSMKIQPAKFALENKLDYCQANAIKYICRHASKNGKQDLEKAKHYIDLLIEHYYGGDELF